MDHDDSRMSRSDWLKRIGIFILMMTIFLLIGNGVSYLIFKGYDIDINTLTDIQNLNPENIVVLKWASTINHIIIFSFSALLWTFIYFKGNYFNIKRLDGTLIFYFITWLLFSLPLIAYSAQLNQMVPIPSWAAEIDQNTMGFLMEMLKMEGLGDLAINIIIIALVPAIGEELLFRGVIQRELMKGMSNGHLAVLIASLLFAFFHLQLNSFLPKFAIGLILGYAYLWTRNILYPVIIHFFNNGFQVLILYNSGEELKNVNEEVIPPIPVFSLIISAILCAVIVDAILKRTKSLNERV